MSFYEKVLKDDIVNNVEPSVKSAAIRIEKNLGNAILSGESSYSYTAPDKSFAEKLVEYLPHHPTFESDFKNGVLYASRQSHVTWESVDIDIVPPQK